MKKPISIVGKIGCGTVILLLVLFAVFLLLPLDEQPLPPDDDPVVPLGGDIYISDVSGVTPGENEVQYDDGGTSLILTPVDEDTANAEIAAGDRVINGTSGDKTWTAVTGADGKETVYVKVGKTTVKAAVQEKPASHGVEKTAAKASALVQSRAAYTKGVMDYNENPATRYLEFADCILYYPAQLSKVKEYENNTLTLRDMRSKAILRITYAENPYISMDEVEGFITHSENDTILAWGPAWYSAETVSGDNVVYTYVGLGEDYIIEAELTYESRYGFVFEKLRALISCKFIEGGVWISEEKDDGYYDETSPFNNRFSTKTVAYYAKALNVILLYPELFSHKGDTGDAYAASFYDPHGRATLGLGALDGSTTMKTFSEMSEYSDVNAISEHAVIAENPELGLYTYAYFGSSKVMVTVTYPTEYAWVYEALLPEIKIIPAEDFSDNTEMQDIVYADVGCRITVPLQFEEVGFYDNLAMFEDAATGVSLSVKFAEITDNIQKTDIFSCFDVTAEDGDVLVGEHHVSWMNNMGYYYGVRGNYTTALLQIDAPNAPTLYQSVLPLIRVEFISDMERIPTAEEEIAEIETPPVTEPETATQPEPEPQPTTGVPVSQPVTKPVTESDSKEPQPMEPDEEPVIEVLPIMVAGLGDLISDPGSPVMNFLMNIDANQIVKGDVNMFRLIDEFSAISDEDIDRLEAAFDELLDMGFMLYEDETYYFKYYTFSGSVNGKKYVIVVSYEYDDEHFWVDENIDWIFDGPGCRAYLTILTEDECADAGDVFLDYHFLAPSADMDRVYVDFDMLYHSVWAQRWIVADLKDSGEFDSDYVFRIQHYDPVDTEGVDYEDWPLVQSYDSIGRYAVIGYGYMDSNGAFREVGRYIYDEFENPATLEGNNDFEFSLTDMGDPYSHNWDPAEPVEDVYDFWEEKAEIDGFFDELYRDMDDYYEEYVKELGIGGGFQP